MNILVLPSWYPPNGGDFFRLQAESLTQHGHKVAVLSVERVSPRHIFAWLSALLSLFSGRFSLVQEGDITVIRSRVPGLPKLTRLYAHFFSFKAAKVFKRFKRKETFKIDVIHAHSLIWGGFAAAKIAKDEKVNFLVTEHRGRFTNNEFVDVAEKYEMNLPEVKEAAQQAKLILCVSSKLHRFISSLSSDTRVLVLPNMLDMSQFSAQKRTELKMKATHFICVAHITPLKGHETLLHAFALLHKDNPDITLSIVGDGWHLPAIKDLAQKLDVESHVHFMGHLTPNEVKSALQKADCFVLPSQYEAFGVVYLEAMSQGLPVIASNTGGAIDFVNKGNGLLVTPNDINALQEAMLHIIEKYTHYDPELISNEVSERFSQSVISEQLNNYIHQVVDNYEL